MKKKSLLFILLLIVLTVLTACNFVENSNYLYNDFTAGEKTQLKDLTNDVIPFIANNEYYFEVKEEGIRYYTIGNTEDEFKEYKETLVEAGYINTAWDMVTGYKYEKGDVVILLNAYKENNKYVIEIHVSSKSSVDDGNGSGNQGGNDDSNNDQGGNTGDQGGNDNDDNNQGSQQENIYYEITSFMPNGLTYITNNAEYPDADFSSTGGLKIRFENQGVQTAQFASTNEVVVSLVINALNENTKTSAQSADVFTIYGLGSNGQTVATATLTSVSVGSNEVTLSGNGIVSVKVIMTGYPHNGNKYCNVVLGEVSLVFDGNTGGNTGNQGGNDNTGGSGDTSNYTYTDFNSSEKTLFQTYFGEIVPFVPNNQYYVEEYSYNYEEEGLYEEGLNFYTYGNTESDFYDYQTKLTNAGYSLDDSYQDDYGDTWYAYSKGSFYLDISYYYYEDDYVIDVYAYHLTDSNGDDGNTGDYTYTDFTSDEKALFQSYFNEVVPFIANNEYYLDEYSYENEEGIYFYTFGNTGSEFDAYRTKLTNSGYLLDDSYVDDYGYTWHCYSKSDFYLDVCFYEYEGDYIFYAYVYNLTETDGGSDDDNQSGNQDNISYVISGSFPSGLTYISNSSDHPNAEFYNDGGLKMRFEGQGVQTKKFNATDKVVVSINIKALNENTKTAQSTNAFTIYGLDSNGNTVATATLTSVSVGGNEVTLTGTGIVSVKVIMTGYPYNGNKYCNVSLAGIDLVFNSNGGSDNTGGSGDTSGHTYTDFTSSEKALFQSYFGETIPFISNNQYYVEEYAYEDEVGINFYTYGNTQSEYTAYRTLLSNSGYLLDDSYVDDYGDTWYSYTKGDFYLDICYYYYESEYIIEVYVFNNSGSTDGGNDGSSSTDVDLITNEGKGLPSDSDGVYDVDFTYATNVKNVTEQGYYLDGCPTSGDVKVLVIPVEFSDRTASSLGYDLNKLNKAFNGTGNDTDYYSVKDYFFISSYEKLSLDFVICDNWFKPANKSTYYENQIDSDGYANGDQIVMDEALAYLSTIMDLSQFDSDGNAIIDAVVLVTTLEIDSDKDFYWAYRYWNYYVDEDGYYYEYDGVSANDYLWVPYQFLYETYDSEGYPSYNDKNAMNTYTFIHEFSHVLGADDYYDYTGKNSPLDSADMMDGMTGDHNAYTKINYGWITSSRLVVADDTVTLTLEDFSKNGDTIIIANNWDPTLGAYQEYYVLMYYTQTSLNGGDYGYFAVEGVVMYHVNASLYKEVYDDETYYDVYNNNTDVSDQNGTVDNLIELCKSSSDTYVHIAGYSSDSNLVDDFGNKIAYTFTVDSINDAQATITFTKNN